MTKTEQAIYRTDIKYPNLKKEMIEQGVTLDDIKMAIGKDPGQVLSKLSKLTLGEAISIRNLFQGCTMSYLFNYE